MSETLHFLPWLRRGLALTLTNRDQGDTTLGRQASIRAWVAIDTDEAETTLLMRPADHATGIDAGQIIRRYPSPGSNDAEYGYFPLVDLAAPDLPWVLTPAAPDEAPGDVLSTGRLRPWLALVCVEEDAAEFVAGSDGRPARLLAAPAQLPDPAEAYGWAHVQSIVPPEEVAGSLTTDPGAVVARLVCPRRLVAGTAYRAAIVAAFRAEGDDLVPALTPPDGSDTAELLVYDTWTFSTGAASSFEELCERLGPVEDPEVVLGLHTTDVTDLGPVDPWPPRTGRVTVDYAGALWDADVDPAGLGRLAEDFEPPVAKLLDQSDVHVHLEPGDPDPVVTPPFYGSYAAGADFVPETGWLHSLNLDPAHRAAAGLGAQVVRIHQERFMAVAWQQAGQLRETNRQLSFTRLQAEIGRTWLSRAGRLDPHQRVAVLRPQLTFVRDAHGEAARRSLQASTFPNALASPAYLRAARPGGVVATAAARRNPEQHAWHASLGETFATPAIRQAMAFASPVTPDGTRFADQRHHVATGGSEPFEPPDIEPPDIERATADGRSRPGRSAPGADTFDLDATAHLVASALRPLQTARRRLEARIGGLAGALAATEPGELPCRVAVGPAIGEALVWSLVELSPELVLPGVDVFPDNAVRVVETNPAFVAAFLAGANHEMARELLWREFPADMAATTFRRFWDRPDRDDADILPMIDWKRRQELDELGAAGGESVVVLIRGDLVRHYPTVRVLLVDPATRIGKLPSFGGWIPPDVRFMAFDVPDADAVTHPRSRWRIVIEEQPTEPRFGLDTIAAGDDPPDLISWNDLAWDHLTGHEDARYLRIGDAFPSGHSPPPGATWGLNSAHMARATYQAPYRITFDVVDLIGSARTGSSRTQSSRTGRPRNGGAS